MMNDADVKYLSAARLMEILRDIPGDAQVMPNRVGNLLVVASDGEKELGFIDMGGDGKYEQFD